MFALATVRRATSLRRAPQRLASAASAARRLSVVVPRTALAAAAPLSLAFAATGYAHSARQRGGPARKIRRRDSDANIHALDHEPDESELVEWNPKNESDWKCPSWDGDVVPEDEQLWRDYIAGENLATQRDMLKKCVNAVCAVNPYSQCARLSATTTSITRTISEFVAHGLPLKRHHHLNYAGSYEHNDNKGVGLAGKALVQATLNAAAAKKSAKFAAFRSEGIHVDPWGVPVDPDAVTLDQERGFLRRCRADSAFRRAGLLTVVRASEVTGILSVHEPIWPHWESPVRDAALRMRFRDLEGRVADHVHDSCGELRTCPTSYTLNAGWMGAVDWLVARGMLAAHVPRVSARLLRRLGRAGGETPCANSFLEDPAVPASRGAQLCDGGVLRGAAPAPRELAVLAESTPSDDWTAPSYVVIAVAVARTRLDDRAEVCELALRLVGAADVTFESVVLPESPITYEAFEGHDGHGLTMKMLEKAGAPSFSEVLASASSWIDTVAGGSRVVYCAHGCDVGSILQGLAAESGSDLFDAPWLDMARATRRKRCPKRERARDASRPSHRPILSTQASSFPIWRGRARRRTPTDSTTSL
jgi:hypothetical protein